MGCSSSTNSPSSAATANLNSNGDNRDQDRISLRNDNLAAVESTSVEPDKVGIGEEYTVDVISDSQVPISDFNEVSDVAVESITGDTVELARVHPQLNVSQTVDGDSRLSSSQRRSVTRSVGQDSRLRVSQTVDRDSRSIVTQTTSWSSPLNNSQTEEPNSQNVVEIEAEANVLSGFGSTCGQPSVNAQSAEAEAYDLQHSVTAQEGEGKDVKSGSLEYQTYSDHPAADYEINKEESNNDDSQFKSESNEPIRKTKTLSMTAETGRIANIVPTPSELNLLGVRLPFFDRFVEENGGLEVFQNMTTREVCSRFIIPKCKKSDSSICQLLDISTTAPTRESSESVVSLDSMIGAPSWYISHAWDDIFLDTIEAIEATIEELYGENDAQNTIVWIDIFSLIQLEVVDLSFDYLTSKLQANILSIGKLMLVMSPWDTPVALKRTWCLYETFICLKNNCHFEIALKDTENDRFLQSIRYDCRPLNNMLSSIKSITSTASYPDQLNLLHRAIEEESINAFAELDRVVYEGVQNWVISSLKKRLAASTKELNQADWNQAIADIYNFSNRGSESIPYYEASLAIRRRVPDDADTEMTDICACLKNLGLLYENQGKLDAAEPLYKEVLSIRRTFLGDENPSTIASLNTLASFYLKQGKYNLAGPLYKHMLTMRRKGDNLHDTLSSINVLAGVHRTQGRYDLAAPLYKEALEISRRINGEDHPETVIFLRNLAAVYDHENDYKRSEAIYNELLSVLCRINGRDSKEVFECMLSLATVCRAQNFKKLDVTEKWLKDALEIARRLTDLLKICTCLNNLGSFYESQERYEESIEAYNDSMNTSRLRFGPDHTVTLTAMNGLAMSYDALGKYIEAEPLYKEVLTIRKQLYGEDDPSVYSTITNLAGLYNAQKRFDLAEQLYQSVLEFRRRVLGLENPDTCGAMNNLAMCYDAQNKYEEALPLYIEALEVNRRVLGDNHASTCTSMNNLAGLYETRSKYELAEPLYIECLATWRRTLGSNHPNTHVAIYHLGDMYRAQGNMLKAKPLLEEYKKLTGNKYPINDIR